MLDMQVAFNIASGIAGFLGGAWLVKMSNAQETIAKELATIHTIHLPLYIRKEDYLHTVDAINRKLERIENTLVQILQDKN